MARKVFFSFHFERDIWRVGQVRNSWLTKPDRESAGFWDKVKWEEVQREGEEAIKRWINNSLNGTSVTVVLIGAETSTRKWVRYEIKRSYERGNGMLGIYIHNIKDSSGKTDTRGENTFGEITTNHRGEPVYFWQLYSIYDWVNNNGYQNLGAWVEAAAKKAGN